MTVKNWLELFRLAKDLGDVVLEIARALDGGDNERAAELARSHGQASGRAGHDAASNAGPKGRERAARRRGSS